MKSVLQPGYSTIEYERQFLFRRPPLDLTDLLRVWILDKYIVSSQLRLRQMIQNKEMRFELSKKLTVKRGQEATTTICLTAGEYDMINLLPAYELQRNRYYTEYEGHPIEVDELWIKEEKCWILNIAFKTEEEKNAFELSLSGSEEIMGKREYSGYEIAHENAETPGS